MITKTFDGFNILHYEEVSSTNKEAFNLIERGVSSETIIIANKQTEGRGRTGKSWLSPKGNLYASLIVNLFNIYCLNKNQKPLSSTGITSIGSKIVDISKLTELTFVSALAVGNTLLLLNFPSKKNNCSTIPVYDKGAHTFFHRPKHRTVMTISQFINNSNLEYKWPNDILIDRKKVSGILLEKRSSSNPIVIGIGINLDCAPLPGTTCIRNYGESISNIDLLKKLVINFNELRKQWLLGGFSSIRKMWLEKAFKINEKITVKLADKLHEGVFIDIDQSGKLVLQQKNRNLIYLDTGELFIHNMS